MNERIKELLERAECVVEGDGYGDGNIELLIQLVVKECAQVASDYDGAHYVGTEIEKHFGVEE